MQTQTQPNLITLLTSLSKDERTVITALVERQYDAHAVARESNLSIVDMLLWLAQPGIRTALEILRDLAETALHLRSVEARRTAIDLLEHVALRATTDLERRRAAVALTRATRIEPARIRKPNQAAEVAPDSDSTPASKSAPASASSAPEIAAVPATSPSPADSPADSPAAASAIALISALTTALADNDNPDHDSGLLFLKDAAAPSMTLNDEPLPEDETDFITALSTSPFAAAVDAVDYSRPTIVDLTATTALLAFKVTPRTTSPFTCRILLSRSTNPCDEAQGTPWQIAAITTLHSSNRS